MRRADPQVLIRHAILIVALLFAQATAATHIDLDDSHPAGDTCVFCAGLSTLGTANVSDGQLFQAVSGPQSVIVTAVPVSFGRCAERCSIRGPPQAS